MKQKNYKLGLPFIIASFFLAVPSLAKVCKESHIRDALSKKANFNYILEGCTNLDGVITVKNTIHIRKSSSIVDGGGKMKLTWKGRGSFSQHEGGPSIIDVNANKVLLKGFQVVRAPDGIHISTGFDNVVDSVVWPTVCEDGLTNGNMRSNAAKRTVVINSSFANAVDKAIQVNGGSIKVKNNFFKNVFRPVSSCGTKANPGYHGKGNCPQAAKIVVVDNVIEDCGGYGVEFPAFHDG